MQYDRFHEAYLDTLKDTYYNPQFFNAPRGNRSRERLNVNITVKKPVERVCYLPSRKTNIIFNFAEALWYLSSNNRLDFISYYAKNMVKYSMDGKTLSGTAYGPKIFEFGNAKINQWNQIKNLLLHKDPDSKRAFMQIFDASELSIENNIDVSCTLGLQFFVRENKLYTASYMRANDAFRGIISDVFSFTFIHEMMAKDLGLEVGDFFHNVGSVHVYEPDEERVEKVLYESSNNTQNVKHGYTFPKLPDGNNWPFIDKVLEYEALLRNDLMKLSIDDIQQLEVPEYWKQVLSMFSLYQNINYNRPIDKDLYKNLFPIYQFFVANKWPELFNEVLQEL
ncbi:thymidylate synthase [Salibacterium salarium]|uniref:Thymidylate synthase n=1 Tax=Salibacterium salarium TaxID=284579 RepID=A0A428MWU5_9BACI|nr:thymidylate synthase [Salibacterium salarium]RSL30601.1 thymidylate synthase [Salibacterium salarium]